MTPLVARADEIRQMRLAGMTTVQVAERFGCHPNTVSKIAPMMPLKRFDVDRIRELRSDGYTCRQVAAIVGCHPHTVNRYAPGRIGKVPVAPLRDAFLASPITAAEIARRLEWWDGRGCGDSSRVKRALGLQDDIKSSKGTRTRRTLVDAEIVERIALAIGVMPWEVMPDEDEAAV